MLTSAGFGSTAARARFLGHRLCEAQRVALLLAEHDCFGLCSRIASTFEKCFFSRLVQGHQCSFQRLVPILLDLLRYPVLTTSCDQSRMALFPLLRAAHKQVIGCFGRGHAFIHIPIKHPKPPRTSSPHSMSVAC